MFRIIGRIVTSLLIGISVLILFRWLLIDAGDERTGRYMIVGVLVMCAVILASYILMPSLERDFSAKKPAEPTD